MAEHSGYPVSILDLATVRHGQSISDAVSDSVYLGQIADSLGYHRIWFAEHHNMPSIASSATSVLLSHMAANTQNIRLGSGGIMLPNHAPLVIAEQFGTLQEVYGPRFDLGLGRAPGTDQRTLLALRREPNSAEAFPSDVLELQAYLKGESRIPGVNAYPGSGTDIPMFILGSSLFGAQLAAELGLGYAFASHFAPQMLGQAAQVYREKFKPSEDYPEPYFIAALNVIADSDGAKAHESFAKAQRERVRAMVGRGQNWSEEQLDVVMDSPATDQVLGMLKYTAVGTGADVQKYMDDFATQYNADELMITNMAPSLANRETTLQVLAEQGMVTPR